MNTNVMGVKRQKFGLGSLAILLIGGVIFALMGYVAVKDTHVDSTWQRISGQIVDASVSSSGHGTTDYFPVVKYSVGSQDYRVTGNLGSSIYPTLGAQKQVAYNPSQPSQARVVESITATLWLWLFAAIGMVAIVFGIISFIRSIYRSRNINNLIHAGQKTRGIIVDVQASIEVNQTWYYKVVVAAPDQTGVIRNYTSDAISGVAGLAVSDLKKSPIPIDVYIDPKNPNSYYVDISDIPTLTPERISELAQMNKKPAELPADKVEPEK